MEFPGDGQTTEGAACGDSFALTLYEHISSNANETKVSVRCGDITMEAVDAIASSTNGHLIHEDGIAAAIVKAGGSSIQKESDDIIEERGPLDIAEVVFTSAGNLPCKYILHVVSPPWNADLARDVTDMLYECCMNLLTTANDDAQVTSLAVPTIGTGICGIPVQICAETMLRAVVAYTSNPTTSKDKLRDIRFIGLDWDTMEVFKSVFEDMDRGTQASVEEEAEPGDNFLED
ncbi:macro domain-containing protein TTE0995-like [Glandiceps talaboti]